MKSSVRSLMLLSLLAFLADAHASTPFNVPHSDPFKKRGSSMDDESASLSHKLFPDEYEYYSGFTTALGVFVPGVFLAPLDDDALNVTKVQKNLTHNVVWQNHKLAWEAIYPEGSINPGNKAHPPGGFGFYLGGTDEFFDEISNGAEEIMLSYSVMFEDGFEFNRGGKLPGACESRLLK